MTTELRGVRTLVSLLVVWSASLPAVAGDLSSWERMFDRDEPRPFERDPESVAEYIEDGEGWYTQVNWTTVWQYASRSKSGRQNLLNTTYNVSGGWAPFDGATVSWWVRGGRPIGSPKDADLSRDVGSLLDVNGSLESDAFYAPELYWAHSVGDHFRYSLGLIDSGWRYDFNAMANSEQTHFLSAALVNSPTIPFPDSSLAADVLWRFNDSISVHAGLYQTNCGTDSPSCFDDLNDDDWLAPVEVVFDTNVAGWGPGTYRLMAFASRAVDKRGHGFSLSVDQQIGRVTPFARISVADREITEVRRFFSVGLGISAPLGRRWDMIGLGVARGEPSDPQKRTETLIEAYWRLQLGPYVALSPDVQLVLDPANDPDADLAAVVGIRLQLDF